MNRLFGKSKPKEPPPNISDCISSVSIHTRNIFKENKYIHHNFITN